MSVFRSSKRCKGAELSWAIFVKSTRPFSSSSPLGLYQLASRDPAATHTSVWWVGQGRGDEEALNPATAGGCTGLAPIDGDLGSSTNTEFSRIPSIDMWGNSMAGTAYRTASQFVNAAGTTVTNPLAETTTFDPSQVISGDQWALAFWNAVDSAAYRIRTDANRLNRVPSDPNNMAVAIHVIGYSGNGGLDQGLRRRVANDKSSTSYDASQATGIYVRAGDKVALGNAFNTVFTAILRLSK